MNSEIRKHIIRYIIYIIFVLGLTSLAFYLTLKDNIADVFNLLKKANIGYIILILGIVVISILLRSIAIFSLNSIFTKDYMFHRAIAIDQVGSLYRMVTPAGLGGHVMETYTYSKQGVKIANALSVIAMYSIVYQVVLILYGIITIIVKSDLINEIHSVSIWFNNNSATVSLWLLVAIGFAFNTLSIGVILLLSYWNGFFRFIRGPIVSLLHKIKLVKDIDSAHSSLDVAVINFRNNLKTLLRNVPILLICVIAFFSYITVSYSVPYICGLSLGNTSSYANFWDSVLLSNLHQMVTCIIPLPGNSLLSEHFFSELFFASNGPKFYSSQEIADASLLLWRSLMFIFPLIIASIYTLVYRPRKKINNEDQENKDTQE